MNPTPAPKKLDAIGFCIAYRRHLERQGRSEFEPPEPNPSDYGMPSTVLPSGSVVEHPLAESLRREVHSEFSAHAMKKAMERKNV